MRSPLTKDRRILEVLERCDRAIENHLRSIPLPPLDVAYHYTPRWEAVEKILSQRCILATHYRDFKDDETEGTVADQHVRAALDALSRTVPAWQRRLLISL